MTERLQCNKCFEKLERVFVESMPDDPIVDVFYCGNHGLLRMNGMELWDDGSK